MKTFASILGITLFSTFTFSAVHTVSNNANSPGTFTSIQAAHDAAAANDTLYIHASETSYGDIIVIKPLVFIGEGVLPHQQVSLSANLNTINLSYAAFPATTTAAGSKFYGLNINLIYVSIASSAGTSLIGSITLVRNRIGNIIQNGNVGCSGHVYTNNVIGGIGMNKIFNFVVSNNILSTFTASTDFGSSNLVTNNVINSVLSIRGAVISNNIFYNYVSSGVLNVSSVVSTYSNNIFYAFTPVVSTDIISGTNTGTGNLFNVDPQYLTPATPEMIRAYTYTAPITGPFADLHLLATSPGKNAGTDGTDIGLYGGNFAWKDGSTTDSRFRYYPMTHIVPQMIEMNVVNPTLPQNGTLNVNFNAKSVN